MSNEAVQESNCGPVYGKLIHQHTKPETWSPVQKICTTVKETSTMLYNTFILVLETGKII